jgi:hypothetical protein
MSSFIGIQMIVRRAIYLPSPEDWPDSPYAAAKRQGTVWSILMLIFEDEFEMGPTEPSRSPLCGMALPDLDMRAVTMTCGKFESRMLGAIDSLSSRVNDTGNSLAFFLRIASGMGGPLEARA